MYSSDMPLDPMEMHMDMDGDYPIDAYSDGLRPPLPHRGPHAGLAGPTSVRPFRLRSLPRACGLLRPALPSLRDLLLPEALSRVC